MEKDNKNIENDITTRLSQFKEVLNSKFILLLTGEWSYAINPFNREEVPEEDKQKGTYNMIDNEKSTIQVAKLFSGNQHDRQIVHLSEYFNVETDIYKALKFDANVIYFLRKNLNQVIPSQTEIGMYMDCPFMERNLNIFKNFEYAYNQFIMDLVAQQVLAIKRIIVNAPVTQIYVDGKFSNNIIFMNLLSEAFFNTEVYAVENTRDKLDENIEKKKNILKFIRY